MDPLTAALNFGTALMNLLALPENAALREANAQVLVKFIGLFERAHAKLNPPDKPA